VQRQLGFDLRLANNRLVFDYMTDQLLGDDTAGSGKLGRESLRIITGQLIPASSSSVQPVIEVTSGSFEGSLRDPTAFIRHDGEKYLPRSAAGWKSSMFSAAFSLRFGKERRLHAGSFYSQWGPQLRFTSFGIPTVVLSGNRVLIDSRVSMYDALVSSEIGVSWLLARITGGLGYGVIDFGKWGRYTGMSLPLQGLAQVRLPPLSLGPAAVTFTGGMTFQLWVVIPGAASPRAFAEGMPDIDLGEGAGPSIASSMYVMWGPQVGVEVAF
jgi:hypothetical protein